MKRVCAPLRVLVRRGKNKEKEKEEKDGVVIIIIKTKDESLGES